MNPRVGHIKFLNSLPLYYGMNRTNLLDSIELVKGTPRELIVKLRDENLDLSAISSIEYCKGDESFLVIPDISISAYESVESVILLSKIPITELNHRTISLSNASSTSHVLLKILLEDYYDINPEYIEHEPDISSMLEISDAALLIGDLALMASWREDDYFKYDLSTEWHRYTGMGVSYAIWVIRDDYVKSESESARWLSDKIRRSIRLGEADLHRIASLAADKDLREDRLERYFRQLSFNLADVDIKGLNLFFRKALDLGFVESAPELRFFR